MKSSRLFITLLFTIGATTIGRQAVATCTFANSQTAQIYTVPVPTLDPSRDIAVGTVIYKQTVPGIPGTVYYAICTSPGRAARSVTGATLVSSVNGVYTYSTNIDGIGVRYLDSAANGSSLR